MIRVRETVVIQRPIDDVFVYSTHPRYTTKWQPGLKEAKLLTEEPMGVGSRVLHRRSLYGKRFESVSEITGWTPPTRYYATDDSGGPFAIGGGVSLESINGQTKVDYEFDIVTRSFLRLIEPIVGAIFRRETKRDFQLLKSQLESPTTVTT